jgi:hypothetical protein
LVKSLRQAPGQGRVRATKHSIIQRLELDLPFGQLFLEILVPVDAKLAGVREVGAQPSHNERA